MKNRPPLLNSCPSELLHFWTFAPLNYCTFSLLRCIAVLRMILKMDIFKLAGDPKFIPGIYNYCDRWCERCFLTSRCMTYAIDTEDNKDPSARDLNNKAFWERLHAIFRQTAEMLNELASEMGVDLTPFDRESLSESMSYKIDEADNHELIRASHQYIQMADKWFESEYSLFEQKEDELNSLLGIGIDETKIHCEAHSIRDAVEIIRWYQHQIYVKLKRALIQSDFINEEQENVIFENDSIGSAKVALIGIDRSIGAWGKLYEHFPESTDSILDILVHINRLRRRVEQLFPQARNFKRPGFDDM